MVSKKSISIFVSAFLIIGFFFLAIPEKGSSVIIPGGPPCCDILPENECVGGESAFEFCQRDECISLPELCVFSEDAICVEEGPGGASCVLPANIPTMSEWGLIALAMVIGIIGFIVFRRRKVTA